MYRITRVEDVSVSRIRSASSWRCWQLAPRSSRLSWRKTWAPSTRGEESTSWESPEKDLGHKILFLLLRLHSAWLTCDHSCILKRTCLYLCILLPIFIVIVFLNAWCCREKDGECPKSPEHVLCQVQQTWKVQGGHHFDNLALLTTSPPFQFRWRSTRSLLRVNKLRAEGGEFYFQSSCHATLWPVHCARCQTQSLHGLTVDVLCKCEQTKFGGSTRLPAIMAPASIRGLQNGALAAARLVTSFFTSILSCGLRRVD